MVNPDLQVFGFGSLVNSATHSFETIKKYTAKNQIREWVTTPERKVSFLSMTAQNGINVAGLILNVQAGQLQDLDRRETGYDRDELGDGIVTYRAINPSHDPSKPILLSYLDCVIQGILTEIGEEAASDFFKTTRNWDRPILNDRKAPIYPRSVILNSFETDFVDAQILEHSLTVI